MYLPGWMTLHCSCVNILLLLNWYELQKLTFKSGLVWGSKLTFLAHIQEVKRILQYKYLNVPG